MNISLNKYYTFILSLYITYYTFLLYVIHFKINIKHKLQDNYHCNLERKRWNQLLLLSLSHAHYRVPCLTQIFCSISQLFENIPRRLLYSTSRTATISPKNRIIIQNSMD